MSAPGKSVPQVLSLLYVILTFLGGFAAGWTYMNFENERQSTSTPASPNTKPAPSFDHATYSTHIFVISTHGVTLLVGGILALVSVFYPKIYSTTKGLYLLTGLYLLHLGMGVFIYSTHRWVEILLAHCFTMLLIFIQCVLTVWVLAHETNWPEFRWARITSFGTVLLLFTRAVMGVLVLVVIGHLAAPHSLEDYVVVRVLCCVMAMFGLLVSLESFLSYILGYINLAMEAWIGMGASLAFIPLGMMVGRMTAYVPYFIIASTILHMMSWISVASAVESTAEVELLLPHGLRDEKGRTPSEKKFCSRTLQCNSMLMILSLVCVVLIGCQVYQRWPEWVLGEYLLLLGTISTLCQSMGVALAELLSSTYQPSPCHIGVRFLFEGLIILAGGVMSFFSNTDVTFTAAVISFGIMAILLKMVLSDRMTNAAMNTQIKIYRMFGKKSGGLLYDADSDWEFTDDDEELPNPRVKENEVNAVRCATAGKVASATGESGRRETV